MHSNDADGMGNRTGPEQTTLIWECTAGSNISVSVFPILYNFVYCHRALDKREYLKIIRDKFVNSA